MDRDVAVWRLHGDATVLITLAHIFNHFAPLMVTPPPLFVLCVSENICFFNIKSEVQESVDVNISGEKLTNSQDAF